MSPPEGAAVENVRRSTESLVYEATSPSAVVTWPVTVMSVSELMERARLLPVGSQAPDKRSDRALSVSHVLTWLGIWPGRTWQERWEATGSEALAQAWPDAATTFVHQTRAPHATAANARRLVALGTSTLLCLGALRPGYDWMFAARLKHIYEHIRQLNDPDFFAEFSDRCRQAGHRERHILDALNNVSRMVMHTGRQPRDLSGSDVANCHAALAARDQANAMTVTWKLLCDMGVISPEDLHLRHLRRKGQRSIEELVDGYDLSCRPVRDLLVRYLHDRAAALDYSTLRGLIGRLVGTFWKDLEVQHPGIDSLRLTPEVAQAWKERAACQRRAGYEGDARTDPHQVLFTARQKLQQIRKIRSLPTHLDLGPASTQHQPTP